MINRLANVFGSVSKALEMVYLFADLKPVVRQGFYENELARVRRFCESNNLHMTLSQYKIVLVDAKDGEYSNKGIKTKIQDERKGMFFAYISKSKEKAELANCYEAKNNHAQLGHLLGYPECCVEFFVKNEPERSKLDNDYILPCVINSKGNVFPFQNNILLRNQDITLLSHFPCSFECKASEELGKKYLNAIRKNKPEAAEMIVSKLKGHQRWYRRIFKFV